MHLKNTKIGLTLLSLMMLAACSTTPKIIKQPILCPQVAECTPFAATIKNKRRFWLMLIYKANKKLSVCIVENQALKKCIDEFNKQEKQ